MTRFQFVANHHRRHGVKRLCTIPGIARSSFYYWRRIAAARAARTAAAAQLAARICEVHWESDGTYGVPRITAELRDGGGQAVNHKRVARNHAQPSDWSESACAAGTAPQSRMRLPRRHRTGSATTSRRSR
ncbi:IS3 family transposase [Streptomyces sp. NBC_00212]|uniref:IS3 family transposase n=1 Tax=Streptomyces sp. NBC_00212 TaxID=2975684 RepID=UPI00386E3DCE